MASFTPVISKNTVFPVTERFTLSSLGHLINNLLEWTEEEGITLAEYFPTDFFKWESFGELGMDYLNIQKPEGEPLQIRATFSWPDLELPLIPDIVTVTKPQFTLDINGSFVSVIIGGVVEIETYKLNVNVHLPSFYLEAELPDTGGHEGHSALNLLKRFNADPGGAAPASPPRLSQLLILAHPRLQRSVFKMALDDLAFGPVTVDTQLELVYESGGFTGMIWGDFLVDINENKKILLTLSAAYDGPGAGWQLEGGIATSGINLVEFFDALLKKFGPDKVQLPEALQGADIELRYLFLSFNTHTRQFTFSCSLDGNHIFGLGEGDGIELNLDLQLAPHQSTAEEGTAIQGYDLAFGGQVIMRLAGNTEATDPETDPPSGNEGTSEPEPISSDPPVELAFDLVFDKSAKSTTLVAAYRNLAGGQVHLKDLVQLISGSETDLGALDFSIDLKQAYLVFARTGSGNDKKSRLLLGLEIGGGIDLSKLPLVGQVVPNASQLSLNFQPYYANDKFSAEELARLQTISPDGLKFPQGKVEKGVDLTITLNLGETPLTLDVPLQLADVKKQKNNPESRTGSSATSGTGSPTVAAKSSPGANDEDDGTKWIDLNKNFGPVHFQRLGFQYADKNLWFRIDGALVAAGLSMSLQGLSVGVSVPDLKPTFELQGLGLAFEKGAFQVGGAFLRIKHPDYDEYAGLAFMKFKALELSAIGAYARVNGKSSLFLYAVLKYPIGGPSFFFVTGLAAGFGYNRNLKLPPIQEVSTFPLVAMATESAGDDASTSDRQANLTTVLQRLGSSIPVMENQYFLAAGIKFSSFKLIDSFLLVSVSFGVRTEIGLLGMSTLQVPMAEATQAGVPPLAVAQLAIRGSFLPEEGFVGIEAQLTGASFILSRDCHLTGGFAFYAWFGNSEHAGDFVLSLGGYHPQYKVPEHYPTVPRLGVDWKISPQLSVKAEMYFALTANALMAGGNLHADFHAGDIKAWFDLGANFIISWKPYYYDAEFHISIGAEVSVNVLLGTVRKTIHAGADVHVWGPEFSGVADIDLMVTTFVIRFGSQTTIAPYISWNEFHTSFLPEADQVIAATVTGGKVNEIEGHVVINPKDFEITVETAVPAGRYTIDDKKDDDSVTVNGQEVTLPTIAMRPLEKGHREQVTSRISLAVSRGGTPEKSAFEFEPILKRMPASLWDQPLPSRNGKPGKPDLNGKAFIENALAGFVLRPKNPPLPGHTYSVDRKNLLYTTHTVEEAIAYEQEIDFIPDEKGTRAFINAHILDRDVKIKRENLLTLLGLLPETFGLDLDNTVADAFIEDPIIGKFEQ